MFETLIGGALGGLFRVVPEVLSFFDRKSERDHELSLQDKQLAFEKLRGQQKLQEIGAPADAAWDTEGIKALQAAIKGQAKHPGFKIVDALSASVRPVITYLLMALYCAAKVFAFVGVPYAGAGWQAAVLASWTPADQALWAGILNFWFLGPVFDKKRVGQ